MRRPRVSDELAARIDAARGDVPFERFVRRALEEFLADEDLRLVAGEPGGSPSVVGVPVGVPAEPSFVERVAEEQRERVVSAREAALERQRALNKAKGM